MAVLLQRQGLLTYPGVGEEKAGVHLPTSTQGLGSSVPTMPLSDATDPSVVKDTYCVPMLPLSLHLIQ